MPTEKRQRQKEGRAARQAALQAHRRKATRRRQVVTAVAIFAIVIIIVALLQRGDDGGQDVTAGSTTTLGEASPTSAPAEPGKIGTAPCPPADGSATRTLAFDGAPQTCIDVAKTYTATVDTDVGTFTVALDSKKAFNTVNNFVFLARYHFYDGVKFHRVIPGFVVQGGDAAKGDGTGDAGYKFADELPKSVDEYKAGAVAMANSGAGTNTNGSQFFVVVSDEGGKQLQQPAYSLFGQVTAGLDVVQKIEADGTPEGEPKTQHQMVKVTIAEA